MADSLVAVIDRFVSLMEAIPDIGRVYGEPPSDAVDLQRWITSPIDGVDTLRAWWVQAPTMEAAWLTGMSPRYTVRTYAFEIHGIEALPIAYEGQATAPTSGMRTLLDFAVAVSDALDADDLDLGGASFDAEPCRWRRQPEHRTFGPIGQGFDAAYAVIEKRVINMPARV